MSKTKINLADSWCDCRCFGFGLTMYVLFVKTYAAPVGFVWGLSMGPGNGKKRRFEVLGSYVLPAWRRLGVRSKINETIFTHADVITTQSGSQDGGRAFMRATGYELDPRTGVWSKTRRRAA